MTQKTSPTLIILVVASVLVVLVFGSYTLGRQSATPPPIRDVSQEPVVPPADDPTLPSVPQVPDVINNAEVRVQTQKNSYVAGEEVSFTITNTTQKDIYYFPETCASRIIEVLRLMNGRFELVPGPDMMCAMAPEVVTLQPGASVIEKVPEQALQQMGVGTYKLQFTYSYETQERFALGERVISQSSTFTVGK